MGSRDLEITVSLGVNTVAPGTKSTDELLGDLHHGLARSKRLGKNRVAVVRGDGVAAESAQQLSNLLQSGTAFRVVGQSIRDVRDARIIGYELLSRGPRGDLETPDAFFRLANEFDMVTEVDLHCLQQCLAASRQLLERGLRVHFNVYPSTLLAVPAENLQQRLGELPEASCLEISEQQVIGEPAYLRDRIAELRRCGLRIAIDDVGFGRSSLESLVVLEPDVIKIDRAFVTGIADEPDKRGFLKRLLSVSQGLGTEVIAEGVETEADARALGDLGVRFAQGFLWDRPAALPANETT